MKRELTIFFGSIVLVAGCANDRANKSPSQQSAPVKKKPGVKVAPAKLQSIFSSVKVGGTIESKMQTTVNAPTEGTVQSLDINEGEFVKAGSILGYVITTDQQNMLALASIEYEREQLKNVGNKENGTVVAARKRLETAKELYKPFPVVSPANGVVISKSVVSGSNVNARQPLMLIADLQELIVKTAVAERHIGEVRIGQEVKLSIPALGDSLLRGKVSMIFPSVDTKSRTCGIEISVPRHRLIKPGMTAVCEIIIASKNSVVVLSHDAIVVKPNGDKLVFTVKNSTAVSNKIKTGLETNKLIEITSGINAGDVVIIAGNEMLKDGAEVKISQPEIAKPEGDKKSRGNK